MKVIITMVTVNKLSYKVVCEEVWVIILLSVWQNKQKNEKNTGLDPFIQSQLLES